MPADGASIGEVYVDILPNVDNSSFWARIQSQLGPGADQAGNRLGAQVSGGIADQIAKGIRQGFEEGFRGQPGREQGRRAGDDFAGEFDRTVRTRLQAALKALPKAQIGASATEAEQKIQDLRAELAELSTKRIGIDVDEATALAEVRRLQEELARLARETPSIRITTDAARASAELEAVHAQAERVAQINPNVHIDTNAVEAAAEVETVKTAADRSTGGMGALLFAGISLGPAIIPVAAAAAAAVAGIGLGALGAAGGLGVVLLGTRGVADAVKSMGAVQASSAASAAQLAQGQQQVASAADSVRSAEASLANARANAADATRRSAETLANAQVSVTQAEQAALRAEQDLTRAREAAKRANEDLAQQVKDGALAQRQAVLDLEKAEQNLAAVRANPAATQIQREEAQLNYEQAKQQIEDLGIRQQRLVADNAAAQKAGVDGSQQVVVAQDRIAQSQDALRRAVQALGDARVAEANTARQNAFAVAQATQGVVSAQRSLEQATVSTATGGSAAMDKLRTSMAALTPEGQRFAVFLFGLRGVVHDLEGTAQRGLLPGAQEGIAGLLSLLPEANHLVGDLAHEVGSLSAEAGQAFRAPYWHQFVTFLDAQAVPALDVFGHSAANTVLGVSGLVRAFAPLGQEVGGGLLHFTQDFARSSLALENTNGFQRFLDYVRVTGPQVVATVEEVAHAGVHLVDAISPLGGPTLTVIRLVAEAINAIPTPVLTTLAGTIIAVTTATRLWGVSQDGLKQIQPILTGAQLLYNQAVTGATTAMASSTGQAGAFGTALAGIRGGAEGAVAGVGTLTSKIGPGGPLFVALAGATALFTLYAQGQADIAAAEAKQQAAADALSTSLFGLAQNYRGVNKESDDYVRNLVKTDPKFRDMVLHARDLGLSIDVLSRALHGNGSDLDEVNHAYDRFRQQTTDVLLVLGHQIDHVTVSADEWRRYNEALAANPELAKLITSNTQTSFDAVNKLGDSVLAERRALVGAAQASRDQATALGLVDGASKDSTGSTQQLTTLITDLGDKSVSTSDKISELKRSEDDLNSSAKSAADAQHAFAGGALTLADALQRSNTEGVTAKTITDDYTRTGHDLNDALRSQVTNAQDVYNATLAQSGSISQANQVYAEYLKKIRDDIDQSALSRAEKDKVKAQLDTLIATYGKIPTDVKTQISVSGGQQALTELQQLEIRQLALEQGIPIDQATKEYGAQQKVAQTLAQGLATGGPVQGPGGPTDDLIPARLSAGEHVWTAAEVQAAGGHNIVMQIRRAVLGDRSPQVRYPGDVSGGIAFAQGGAVEWPFSVNVRKLWEPTLAQLQQRYQYGPAWTGPVSQNVASVQAWLKAQAGKPYGWDEAGPAAWDCSGIVSSAYLLLGGQNPYRHLFSTQNEGTYFNKPGWGVLTAGWTNPGERGPGGNSVGHTAGVLAGLPFESRGGAGVVVGAGVTPIGSFAHIGHYDSGGVLPPGLTIARNDTGQNEWVMTDNQIAHVASGAGRSQAAGGPLIENVYVRDSDPHGVAVELDWILRTRGG